MNIGLLNLLQLSDPTLPIGGFSHSAGLETYVQQGIVHDAITAELFVKGMLVNNLQYNDVAFAGIAYDGAKDNNFSTIRDIDEFCNAVKLPREIREASQKLGMRLLKIYTDNHQYPLLLEYRRVVMQKEAFGHYGVAFGIISALQNIPKTDMLTGFYYNAAIGIITNCVKLIPLGQQDGQRLLFEVKPLIAKLVADADQLDPELLGLCAPGFDMRSMQHEVLYSRLYMS
jgi:urease accessory protein